MQTLPNNFKYNHIYFPIVFNDKKQLINVIHCLNKKILEDISFLAPIKHHIVI